MMGQYGKMINIVDDNTIRRTSQLSDTVKYVLPGIA